VTDQFIFLDEVWRAQAPLPFVTLNTVGPTLMSYGTPEQKQAYLPGILTGDVNFAIGYTEPEAGTTSPRCAPGRPRRRRVGDQREQGLHHGANQADYIWLACRTDPDAPSTRHLDISCPPRRRASRGRPSTPSPT